MLDVAGGHRPDLQIAGDRHRLDRIGPITLDADGQKTSVGAVCQRFDRPLVRCRWEPRGGGLTQVRGFETERVSPPS